MNGLGKGSSFKFWFFGRTYFSQRYKIYMAIAYDCECNFRS